MRKTILGSTLLIIGAMMMYTYMILGAITADNTLNGTQRVVAGIRDMGFALPICSVIIIAVGIVFVCIGMKRPGWDK